MRHTAEAAYFDELRARTGRRASQSNSLDVASPQSLASSDKSWRALDGSVISIKDVIQEATHAVSMDSVYMNQNLNDETRHALSLLSNAASQDTLIYQHQRRLDELQARIDRHDQATKSIIHLGEVDDSGGSPPLAASFLSSVDMLMQASQSTSVRCDDMELRVADLRLQVAELRGELAKCDQRARKPADQPVAVLSSIGDRVGDGSPSRSYDTDLMQEAAHALSVDSVKLNQKLHDETRQVLSHAASQDASICQHQQRLDELQARVERCEQARSSIIHLDHVGDSGGSTPLVASFLASVDRLTQAAHSTSLRCDDMELQVALLRGDFAKCERRLRESADKSVAVSSSCGQQVADANMRDQDYSRIGDTCANKGPADVRLEGPLCTTEMRCDRVEKQLSELHKEISELQVGASENKRLASTTVPLACGTSLGRVEQENLEPKQEQMRYRASTVDLQVESLKTSAFSDGYAFQESVWDLALFIGFPHIGLGGSIFATILLIANGVLQVLLILIINESFTEKNIDSDTQADMRRWRVFFGHSWDLVDKITFEPLVSRVCEDDKSVPYAAGIVQVLHDIADYMPSERDYDLAKPLFGHLVPHMEEIGMILCLLAIVIWLLEIVAAFDGIWRLGTAVANLPRSGARSGGLSLHTDRHGEESIVLQCVSNYRKCWCGVLIILQFLCAFTLGVIGVAYMIFTTSMRDLLLNCSALAVVIQLDEQLYNALAPRTAKKMIQEMRPLPRSKTRVYAGLDVEVLFFLACIIATVTFAYFPLREVLEDLKATYEEICGGSRHFVAMRDNAGIINAGITRELNVENTYFFRAVRQLVADKKIAVQNFGSSGSMSATVSGMTGSIWSLQTTLERNVDEIMGYWNPQCKDLIVPPFNGASQYYLQILQDVALDTSIQGCGDVKSSCNADDSKSTRVRQFCPDTCGCNNASSGLILDGIVGCAPGCKTSAVYQSSMWAKPCEDENLTSAYWVSYVAGLRTLAASYPASWVTDFEDSIDTILQHGCRTISGGHSLSFVYVNWTDLCVTSASEVKSLIYACPLSCRCHVVDRSGCPYTCRSLRSLI